jgi:hypothetical protein
MADFVQNTVIKSGIRELADPIADVAVFITLVQSIPVYRIMTAGLTHETVEKTREGYMVKILYQDTDAKTVGTLSDRFSTISRAGAAALLANTAIATAHGVLQSGMRKKRPTWQP